jgi:MerR family transcriptional regulator, light-induced transcriptional regulator
MSWTNQERAADRTSIGAVERDTGLSKDTLRVWERRYGFPRPARDAFGERAYSVADVDKLRVIRRLIDLGHRPGRIIGLPLDELQQLALAGATGRKSARAPARAEARSTPGKDLQAFVELVKQHRMLDLRTRFTQEVLRLGLARFVTSIVAPLNDLVGDAWTRGYFEVYEEHLYTETVQVVLRNAINAIPQSGLPPKVLLTTFPQEPHGLGVLMAEALLSLEGCRCVSLGTQTPIWDIVLAARAHKSDVVALSFSSCLAPNPVLNGLAELRLKLPLSVEIWAGGACPILHRRPPAQVRTFRALEEIGPAVAEWRADSKAA